jgi:coatomer protein complex subunit gamma
MAAPGSVPQSLKETIKEKIATALKDNLKLEEKEFVNPWSNQDKASVLQQTRCFSDTPIDSEKCMQLITRVLYLLQQGEKFTSQELTDLFFGCTKLFQVSSTRLRRMVFLVIKELEPPDEIAFIVASSLIKDMNGKNDCFRANSIRVLGRILDPSMVAQIDRYLKTAIVDKNPFVASSALVCGMTLIRTVPDVVKRWVNEIQETVTSKHSMVQFHALALIYQLKKQDRLALHKVVLGLAKAQGKSPIAECLLIRYATQILATERDPQVEKTLLSYLDSCLRHKSEMVTYEAARSFCQLADVDRDGAGGSTVFGHDIVHVTTTLQIFLTSPKAVVRFGAIRTLNQLAQHRPNMAARCNVDMETLLSDPNRNTATLALTTLLKTGHESNVESLVKQITTFMSDISDVFKIEVVAAVKGLCLKYPSKYKTLMSFLSTNLREDGSADFKKDLVDALLLIISKVPAAREVGLLHLCEFIEDCEYPNLCTKILSFLGEEVPNTSVPSKYIRFIYNRMILENAPVRAASVDALTKIAMRCPKLRRDVMLLLNFAQNDNDDEVRERINLYSSVLHQCLEEGKEEANEGFGPLMTGELPFSMDALFDNLLDHVKEGRSDPFSTAILPSKEVYEAQQKAQAALQPEKKKPGPGGAAVKAVAAEETVAQAAEKRANASAELNRVLGEIVGDLSSVGPLQHSCKPKSLTENEAEYTVQVVKHMFKQHAVLEFVVQNTVQGITLEDVSVVLTGVEPSWTELGATKINRLEYGQQTALTVVLQKNGGDDRAGALQGNFGAKLTFLVKEEGDDLGYEDEYPIEGMEVSTGDYMFPRQLPAGQFKSAWEQLTAQGVEATQKLSLTYKSLDAAVAGIIQVLNMEACEGTGKVEAGVRGHTLNMSGTFLGGHTCLVKALVGMDQNHGCVAKIACRAKSEQIAELIAKAMM